MEESDDTTSNKSQNFRSTRKKMKHTCATCNREIIDENFIRCTVCKGFILCLECFSVGYEKDSHIRTHRFVFMNPSTDPIFSKDWTAEEELLLIHSIGLCGIGNWVDVASQMKTKSAIECEIHYFQVYLGSSKAPLPDCSLPVQDPIPLPPPLPFDTSPRESWPSDGHEKNLMLQNKQTKTTPAEISGYMPRRHEFEDEFNDDAERLLDLMTFDADDTENSIDEKCKLLELYNSQIRERKIRTKVVEEWKIQYKKFKTLGGSTSKEREIDQKIITLAQFIGKKKAETLADSLHRLSRNEGIIEMRQQWQRNGVQTLHEGFLFNKLEAMVKDNKVQDSEISKWNKAIAEYNQEHGSVSTEDEKLLNEHEAELCKTEEIQPPIYSALKDLFIRECAVRDGLTKEEALRMTPEMTKQAETVYDFLISVGWISE
ncbi:Myb-like DNA-binding domain containing protein [Tritrichomonas foetus]|uniref:Myb-like DNA-binding domain containing protein n=1 Tax=Tritrichomonas foetus TaxID=1144522 RepID=A0A1J4KHA9_9EUKA|nr:Myb-like DNA-binding domain containing protein [Tritrichomonas foetus]|eukprot:OHT10426.1 Myb-like DNA-binding domain containing protein [Tritrichomonas foetus]